MAGTKTRAETLIDEINGSAIFCVGVLNLVENDGCQNAAPCVSAICGVDKLLCQIMTYAQELETIITKMKNEGKLAV